MNVYHYGAAMSVYERLKSWEEALDLLFFMQKQLASRFTLTETNRSPLKMDGWNTTFLLGRLIFRCYVSFREGNWQNLLLVGRWIEVNSCGITVFGDFEARA